ncbi:MAG TPA: type II secretion system protein [Candidatus Hydrogenedentes bacterium]|nr:type II secretion system protein [Candidatus Hydrogenedentota bacterium]HOL76671.1 type II secretion system protein [Candidatus Hydrogenedentota bacterium]
MSTSLTMMRGRTNLYGFTLIELTLVVIILGILAAGVAPLFAGSITTLREERATRDVVALLRHAGERAVIEGVEYRVYIDPEHDCYQLVRTQLAEKNGNTDGKENDEVTLRLPESLHFLKPEAAWDSTRESFYVPFAPNGSTGFATIPIKVDNGDTLRITIKGTWNRIEVESS